MASSRGANADLIRVTTMDLSVRAAREAFLDHAPAIVQKVAVVDEDAADFVTTRYFSATMNDQLRVDVLISLDARGRTTESIVDELCQSSIEGELRSCLDDVFDAALSEAHSSFEAVDGPAGPTNAGHPETHHFDIEVDKVDFERMADELHVTFEASFDASYSASVVRDLPDGSGLDDGLQGDAFVTGRFEASVVRDVHALDDEPFSTGVQITEWTPDIDIG